MPNTDVFEVRLDANESPSMLAPEAHERLARALAPDTWSRYPDARAVALREAIAARCGASPDEILAGIGSDEVIALVLTALDRPRPGARAPVIVTPSPTFVMYKLSGLARGYDLVEAPLDDAWDLDVAAMTRAIEERRPNVVFLATPNNPTGGLMSLDRIEQVIRAAEDALVILDEAYVDFSSAGTSQIDLRRRYPNVAVMRTISKVGFAALRLGWLIAPAELVREIDKVRQPFSIPVPTQRGATFVLRELAGEIERLAAAVVSERRRLAEGLSALGFDVPTSEANFLWIGTRRPAREVLDALAQKSILVKSFHPAGGRLTHRLRITVGTPAENDRLLREIAACA